jgi:hypothetical protein
MPPVDVEPPELVLPPEPGLLPPEPGVASWPPPSLLPPPLDVSELQANAMVVDAMMASKDLVVSIALKIK